MSAREIPMTTRERVLYLRRHPEIVPTITHDLCIEELLDLELGFMHTRRILPYIQAELRKKRHNELVAAIEALHSDPKAAEERHIELLDALVDLKPIPMPPVLPGPELRSFWKWLVFAKK